VVCLPNVELPEFLIAAWLLGLAGTGLGETDDGIARRLGHDHEGGPLGVGEHRPPVGLGRLVRATGDGLVRQDAAIPDAKGLQPDRSDGIRVIQNRLPDGDHLSTP